MPRLHKYRHPVSTEEYWVDQHGVVRGKVRNGKPREDEKESTERWQVETFLQELGWPVDSKLERPPSSHTYDFDCVNSKTEQRIAVEIKRILPDEMAELVQSKGTDQWVDVNLLSPVHRLEDKAAAQLIDARVDRRCVLLVWPYEESETSPGSGLLRAVLDDRYPSQYEHVDEWWLTTSLCRRFWQLLV
jgi:hypothetical protein